MATPWSTEQIALLDRAQELEITTRRRNGALRPWVPIWVVCVGDEVYVRTWYRRDTGWFGHAVAAREARIRVPGLETDVSVEDVGLGSETLRSDVDAAYLTKYGGGGSMVSDSAAEATLRLRRA